jgi:hypothetical protein
MAVARETTEMNERVFVMIWSVPSTTLTGG